MHQQDRVNHCGRIKIALHNPAISIQYAANIPSKLSHTLGPLSFPVCRARGNAVARPNLFEPLLDVAEYNLVL